MIVVGSVSAVAVLLMVVMLFVLYFRKGKKKLPPADVIPEVSPVDGVCCCVCSLSSKDWHNMCHRTVAIKTCLNTFETFGMCAICAAGTLIKK